MVIYGKLVDHVKKYTKKIVDEIGEEYLSNYLIHIEIELPKSPVKFQASFWIPETYIEKYGFPDDASDTDYNKFISLAIYRATLVLGVFNPETSEINISYSKSKNINYDENKKRQSLQQFETCMQLVDKILDYADKNKPKDIASDYMLVISFLYNGKSFYQSFFIEKSEFEKYGLTFIDEDEDAYGNYLEYATKAAITAMKLDNEKAQDFIFNRGVIGHQFIDLKQRKVIGV